MPTREAFELTTQAGRRLQGLLDLPDEPGQRPTIVAVHGFKGFMEWGFFPYLADLLAARGFTVVRFNFSGSGMRPGEDHVGDLDGFRDNTVSREVEETLEVLDALGTRLAPGRVDRARVGLFGHSRGGGIALLAAAHPAPPLHAKALVTWASVSHYDRIDEEEKRRWRESGSMTILHQRTGQELSLGLDLLRDIEEHAEELDLERAAARRRVPWLIVHGAADETVPAEEARRLYAAAAPPVELLLIPGADHGLGGRHPFPGPRPSLIEALNATQTWFRRAL